ncbi:hypothetical protein SAMN05421543_1594 [Alicyclobacillus macrosporangiidus]|uniref:Uncharacterized protein n=1 Tax=Alicyclobacillus macrosporangiidus TaxID=392015 RepID=A0A1I7LIC6_9BACL|nr:hypothetical protein [Alicyclobacillus macrosporangiidus]SFV09425.1 hypothetical protein SAMN05421543_1594 [Alicyclobacillus macrosporangiidus]
MTDTTVDTMGVITMTIIATTITMITMVITKIIMGIMITTIMKIHLHTSVRCPGDDARIAGKRTMSQTIFVLTVERA